MANLPRFGRTWQRLSTVAPPAPAAAQPAQEPEPEILPFAPTTKTVQPFEPTPPAAASPPSSPTRESTPRLSSPAKKADSPSASPRYKATVTRVPSPPVKPARSPPVSPAKKSFDGRPADKKIIKPAAQTTPPQSPKSRRTATPPLSPLALPRTQINSAHGTTAQSRILPEVEQKSGPYKKTVEKPPKSDRQSEYSSGKPPQKQQAEVINLTGHNVGAVMEISQFSDKRSGGEVMKKSETEGGVHHGNDERKTGAKDKSQRAYGFLTTAFMNSNFQEVNNSVMYESSCSGRDPGLHIAFSGKPNDDGSIFDGNESSKY